MPREILRLPGAGCSGATLKGTVGDAMGTGGTTTGVPEVVGNGTTAGGGTTTGVPAGVGGSEDDPPFATGLWGLAKNGLGSEVGGLLTSALPTPVLSDKPAERAAND